MKGELFLYRGLARPRAAGHPASASGPLRETLPVPESTAAPKVPSPLQGRAASRGWLACLRIQLPLCPVLLSSNPEFALTVQHCPLLVVVRTKYALSLSILLLFLLSPSLRAVVFHSDPNLHAARSCGTISTNPAPTR